MWSWYRAFYCDRPDLSSPLPKRAIAITGTTEATEGTTTTTTTTGSASSTTASKGYAADEGMSFHQVFLTVSPILALHVRQYFEGLLMAHNMSVAGLGLVVERMSDVPAHAWPLVTTYAQFLRLIDGTLEESFFADVEEVVEFAGGAEYIMKKEDLATVTSKSMAMFFFMIWLCFYY
jgi:hypothetical protein